MTALSNVPQLVDKKGGSYSAVAPRLELENFNKWKKRMLCYLTKIEPYYIQCINDGPFKPKTTEGDDKHVPQWTPEERRAVNQDQRMTIHNFRCDRVNLPLVILSDSRVTTLCFSNDLTLARGVIVFCMTNAKLGRRVSMSFLTYSICSGGGSTAVGGGGDGDIDDGSDGEGDLDLLRDKDGKSDGSGEDDGKSDCGDDNYGMCFLKIKQIVAQRVANAIVANAIETIAIYEAKTRVARELMNRVERQKDKVVENASNKRKYEVTTVEALANNKTKGIR
uniref:Retrovirus-related Pol polyprotein from transposon TNT 1-94 n=1 Tax=Tanacetum cinerariifolium TaxID=118510 RepID=A0A6L2P6Z6_TANCI|nr:retrovirus-related Pol polyprotein from transposon TNT 1-94 [Tanacetum cinerariifolium]